MTYEKDPSRWTDASATDVPEGLRELMQAGAKETPSAAKLAALGAKISTTTTTTSLAAAGSAAGISKLWLAGLALGVVVAGGVVMYAANQSDSPAHYPAQGETSASASSRSRASDARADGEPIVEALQPSTRGTSDMKVIIEPLGTAEDAKEEADATDGPKADAPSNPRTRSAAKATARRARRAKAASPRSRERNEGTARDIGYDVKLLQQARRALSTDPASALKLARRHADEFPRSQFSQERDALVIEALTRSGRLRRARGEARQFVEQYPTSAHAHRFRERLGL